MKPSEFLAELRRRLKSSPKAWGKGSASFVINSVEDKPRCILGWARVIDPDGVCFAEARAFGEVRTRVGDLILWNDARNTTLWDVLGVLGATQRQMEAEGQ